MQLTKIESKHEHSTWHNEAGELYIVVDGLDPNQIHTPGTLETFMAQNFGFFAVIYWLILTTTFTFLIIHFLVRPLLERKQQGLPLFSDE